MLFVFDTCLDWFRTMPTLQHDKNQPEDLNSDMEDHAADETRYACMSRPWTPTNRADARKEQRDYGLADDEDEDNWKTR